MIYLPTTLADLDTIDNLADGAVIRAGGTHLQERLRSHNAHPTIVDLGGIRSLAEISRADDG